MKVAIVTDSSACLPRDLVEQYRITVVPIPLAIDGRVYLDGVDITPSELYRYLETSPVMPTSAAPSPGAFLEVYRRLARDHDNILCVTISSQFSAIYQSAVLASEMMAGAYPDLRISVVDSGAAAMAQGFAVLEAARAAERLESLDDVAAVAGYVGSKGCVLAMLDTLHYLARSGRVPRVAAWAGSLLSIKPIIELSQRRVGLVARPRTEEQSIRRLLLEMKKRLGASPVHMAVFHTNEPEKAEKLKIRVESMFNCVELYLTEFTPVMGIHTGPGLLGAAFFSES